MKKLIISVLFCLVAISLSAQNTFFKWYPTDKFEFINNTIELNNKCFLLSGSQSEQTLLIGSAYFLKIDSTGNLLSENIDLPNDTNSLNMIIFSLPNDNNFINVLKLKKIVTGSDVFEFLTFEKYNMDDYTLISNKTYSTPKNKSYGPQSVIIIDSSIYIQSILAEYTPNMMFKGSMVSKYNFNFDSITTYVSYENLVSAFGIINDSINQRIKSYTLSNGVGVKNLNYDLTISDSLIIPLELYPNASVTLLNDNKYILTGIYTNIDWPKQHIKVGLCNMNDQVIDSVSYRNHPDSILYCGFVSNTTIISNNIFIVGNYKINPSQFPYQNTPTYIQITRIDTNMNIIDHHFYGGDAVYTPYKILATSDGGALITGIRYDHTNPSVQLCHPFALKVNNEGVVVDGIEDELNPIFHSAIVFPNPGKDIINLTSGIQLNNGIFTLFDIQGRPIITKKIISTEMQFDASHLVPGTYLWHIVLNNNVVEKGKWVKN